jgi:glycogen phosphorylase
LLTDVEGFDSLAELTLDMRWSWNHASDEVWRQLDPGLWLLFPRWSEEDVPIG